MLILQITAITEMYWSAFVCEFHRLSFLKLIALYHTLLHKTQKTSLFSSSMVNTWLEKSAAQGSLFSDSAKSVKHIVPDDVEFFWIVNEHGANMAPIYYVSDVMRQFSHRGNSQPRWNFERTLFSVKYSIMYLWMRSSSNLQMVNNNEIGL